MQSYEASKEVAIGGLKVSRLTERSTIAFRFIEHSGKVLKKH